MNFVTIAEVLSACSEFLLDSSNSTSVKLYVVECIKELLETMILQHRNDRYYITCLEDIYSYVKLKGEKK